MFGFVLAFALTAAQAPPSVAAGDQTCQSALGSLYEGTDEADLPGQVDGATLNSADALLRLRADRGDALIVVKGGHFAGADFRGASLHNICFLDTDLGRSDWRGADATGIGFVRADLSGARLAGADLGQVLLREATLTDVDAAGADLSGGRLDGGWAGSLDNLGLDDADLSRFRFDCGITLGDGCPLERRISLRRANLTEARIDSYWLIADWTGSRIDGTQVGLHQLQALAAADIAGPLTVRGGDAAVEIRPQELRTLLAHARDVERPARPAFDCARAGTEVERTICGDDGGFLRALDQDMASLYRRALLADPSLASGQRAWLADRDRCTGDALLSCLDRAYRARRAFLAGRLRPDWLGSAGHVLFVVPDLGFDEGFQSDPLYRRLLPVIIGSASAHVAIRVNADGSLDARGSAVGANAHLCSLGAERLRIDPDTGWYSAARDAAADEPAPWRGRPVPVLLLSDDRAEVYEQGRAMADQDGIDPRAADYASCGARAGFEPLVRVPVSEGEARSMFESLEQ
ncbi:pentapeptide repeat-containing protein [Sphingosinicella terrae]|uniref:pentapeptide repeat-containing protein n=1 Tax=Sphingosinicella terrae TaxID=2172047 RepID=UPI000E0D9D27|nr:pentapeptide repeat-containing protein [Sphingosinicella terrae]